MGHCQLFRQSRDSILKGIVLCEHGAKRQLCFGPEVIGDDDSNLKVLLQLQPLGMLHVKLLSCFRQLQLELPAVMTCRR